MGQVWRARDLLAEEARDRHPYVAVKVLNRDFEGHPDALAGLHREALRAQQLAHPNIATVHIFDRDESTGRSTAASLGPSFAAPTSGLITLPPWTS